MFRRIEGRGSNSSPTAAHCSQHLATVFRLPTIYFESLARLSFGFPRPFSGSRKTPGPTARPDQFSPLDRRRDPRAPPSALGIDAKVIKC